jgi:hypothetical protein
MITINRNRFFNTLMADQLQPFNFYHASTGELIYMVSGTWALAFKDGKDRPAMTTAISGDREPYVKADPGVSVTFVQD